MNKGTQFQVYLPAVRTAISHTSTEDVALPSGHHELILVVDDEAPIREVTKATLDAHGYRVITANDGKEAIAQFVQHQSDISLVLTDIMMPAMDGRALIQTLRSINPEMKVIAFSGLISNEKLAVTTEVDAFLVTGQNNIYYLTGFWGTSATVFISKSRRLFVTDARYTLIAKQSVQGFGRLFDKQHGDPHHKVAVVQY